MITLTRSGSLPYLSHSVPPYAIQSQLYLPDSGESYAYENGFTDADNNWRTSFLKCGKVIMARINCKCSELIPVNSQRNIISLGANMNKDFYICATYGMMVMYASGYLAIIAQQEIPANSWIHGYFVTLLN